MAIDALGNYQPDQNPTQDVGLGQQLQNVNLDPITNPNQQGNVDPSRFYNTQYGNTIRDIQDKYTQARAANQVNPQATGLGGIQQQNAVSALDANKSFADVKAQGALQQQASQLNQAKQQEALAPLQLGSQISQNQAGNTLEAAKIQSAANEGVLNRGESAYQAAQEREHKSQMGIFQTESQERQSALQREAQEKEAEKQRSFQGLESFLGRGHEVGKLNTAQDFQRREAKRRREFEAEQGLLGREHTSYESREARKFQGEQSAFERGSREGIAEAERLSREGLTAAELGVRLHEGKESRLHAAREARLGREAASLESALTREHTSEEAVAQRLHDAKMKKKELAARYRDLTYQLENGTLNAREELRVRKDLQRLNIEAQRNSEELKRAQETAEAEKNRAYQWNVNRADRRMEQRKLDITERNHLMNYLMANNTQRQNYDLARSRLDLDTRVALYQNEFNAQTIANNAAQIKNAFRVALMRDARTAQEQEWAEEQAARQYVMLAQQTQFNQMLQSHELDLKTWTQKTNAYLQSMNIQLDAAKVEQLQQAYDNQDKVAVMRITAELAGNLEGQNKADETLNLLRQTQQFQQRAAAASHNFGLYSADRTYGLQMDQIQLQKDRLGLEREIHKDQNDLQKSQLEFQKTAHQDELGFRREAHKDDVGYRDRALAQQKTIADEQARLHEKQIGVQSRQVDIQKATAEANARLLEMQIDAGKTGARTAAVASVIGTIFSAFGRG